MKMLFFVIYVNCRSKKWVGSKMSVIIMTCCSLETEVPMIKPVKYQFSVTFGHFSKTLIFQFTRDKANLKKKSNFGSETIDKPTGNNPMDKYFAKNIILVRHFIGFDSSVSNRHYLFHFNHIKTIYILTGIQFKPRQF